MSNHFPQNLQLLCSHYKSISEVCRKLGINRSQFNKYLNGSTQPSRHTLKLICNFFGVEVHEIYLPHHQFANIIQIRPQQRLQQQIPEHFQLIQQLHKAGQQNQGERYAGYYFEYYFSMSFPGQILRSLVHVRSTEHGLFYDRMERLKRHEERNPSKGFKCHYQGMMFHLADRIFMLDCESLTQNEITQTILFPTYKSRTSYLTGLKLGVTADARRTPTAVRVVLEVLPKEINERAALRLCGLFDPASENIASEVKALIQSGSIQDEKYFSATPL